MRALDLAILIAYLAGTVLFGAYFSRSQKDVKTYFVSSKHVPWWVIMASVVSTETSSVTFVSVPGFAFTRNFTFLQLVMGYLVGRIAVSAIFIPLYFRGELLTVYQLLGQRFGSGVRRLASSLFLITRSLADGFRLYLTGLVLAAVLLALPGAGEAAREWLPGLDPRLTVIVVAVLVMGVATVIYSYLGGMSAVIWTDVTQLVIYVIGAVVAAVILLGKIPGGWGEVARVGGTAGKFTVFDFASGLTKDYTFWSGLIGGAFLTTATHGTDQLMVQRYLCARSLRQASVAVVASGFVVIVQFALFLVLGLALWKWFGVHPAEAPVARGDAAFPQFIVQRLSKIPGAVGVILGAIFAVSMSTLSSSLNSSAAALVNDFLKPTVGRAWDDARTLRATKLATLLFALVQGACGLIGATLVKSVVDSVLQIASFTTGVTLGLFFLARVAPRASGRAALAGAGVGLAALLVLWSCTPLSWAWYSCVGSGITCLVGVACAPWLGPARGEAAG